MFKSGVSDGASPVNYLLRDTDHAGKKRPSSPEVLDGSPGLTIQCIDAITRKYKYVSGAIAFRDCEQPTREQLQAVIRAFKATMCPGLEPHEFNSLFVLHQEATGSCHVHWVVPMVEFRSKQHRQLNVHPPGEENLKLYEAFTQAMNHELGYEQVQPDPLKLALSDFERRAPGKSQGRAKAYLHKQLTREIRRGVINCRDDLCTFLTDQYGVEVTRQGADYLSLRFPGEQKARRFRGPLYEHGADYRQLVQASGLSKPFLTPQQADQVRDTLAALVANRRAFFDQRCKPKEFRRHSGQPVHVDSTTITLEKRKMKTNQPRNPAVLEALRVIAEVTAERHVPGVSGLSGLSTPLHGLARTLKSIQDIRRDATMSPNETRQHAAADAVHEVEAALASLDAAIQAASADITSAKNPKQRSAAEIRLAKLMEQKRRLEVQLGQAKVRQLNTMGNTTPR